MNTEQKLDRIIELLEKIANHVDPINQWNDTKDAVECVEAEVKKIRKHLVSDD